MSPISTAMVFAAGLGTRMQPLSLAIAKPLLPLLGRPLLDHALDRLKAASVQRVIVNHHYLGEQVAAYLQSRQQLETASNQPLTLIASPESELLETGGGLVKASPHMQGSDAIFVINGDCLWRDGDGRNSLLELASQWQPQTMDALLLLQPVERAFGYDGMGDFFLDAAGLPQRRGERKVAPFVYCGIQIFKPSLVANLAVEKFSVNRIWDEVLARGRLGATVHHGEWYHLSTPADLEAAEAHLQAANSS